MASKCYLIFFIIHSLFDDVTKQEDEHRQWNRKQQVSVVGMVDSTVSWLDIFPCVVWWQPELFRMKCYSLNRSFAICICSYVLIPKHV